MNVSQLLLMRHELVLIGIALLILIAELAVPAVNKRKIIPAAVVLFGIALFIGFLPMHKGELFGGSFYTDSLICFMKNILNLALFLVFLQAYSWLQKEENQEKITEYFLLILSAMIGMFFMISARNFLMMYVGLELASIPMAALAAYERHSNKSAEAGIKLILSSAFASGVLLFGLSIIYGTTGSTYFSDVAGMINTSPLQTLGFVFFVSGMAFKISLVPFHLWTADVYEGSPINVTAYLSVVSKGAAVFIFAIMLYRVFGCIINLWEPLLYILAVATMTVGNLFAFRQDNLKRFLAFSSIAQAGFILLGIMGAGSMGIASVVYFIMIYVFTNLAAFGVVAAVFHASGKENISDYQGLYQTNPRLSLTMMLAMFSLAGIPPIAGFFGKFFLFTSAAGKGYYILILIAVLNATLSLYYYLKVIKAMFIDKSEEPIAYFKTDLPMKISLLICVAGMFVIGLAGFIHDYIRSISFGM